MNKILKLNAETLQLEEIKVNNNIVTCEELHNAIGGNFEHINFNENFIKNRIDIWVDEEGKLKEIQVEQERKVQTCENHTVLAKNCRFIFL